jgi:hypothetical protein
MPTRAARYAADLAEAVDAFDRSRVEALCDEIIDAVASGRLKLEAKEAGSILGTLRRKRHFTLTEKVGAGFVGAGWIEPVVWRQYAQALIEQKKLAGALAVLSRVVASTSPGEREHLEALGLSGRTYKQHFIDLADQQVEAPHARQALIHATALYHAVFQQYPSELWHGINAVALARRAAADRIALPTAVDAAGMSAAILAAVQAKVDAEKDTTARDSKVPAFDVATALEACVALGRWPEALVWADRYVQNAGSDAFEIGSTLRQLTEVWRLGPTSKDGGSIIVLLQAHLLAREGGQVSFTPPQVTSPRLQSASQHLQAQLGSEEMIPVRQLQKALGRCQSVAMIRRTSGTGFGTGFVVSAAELGFGSKDELLLLTNAHVVSDDLKVHKRLAAETGQPPLWPHEARVDFTLDNVLHKVDKLLWTSDPRMLDATLLRLAPRLTMREVCPLDTTPPPIEKAYPRVYVVGHPGGRELTFSLSDNKVLGFRSPKLHYRTPTEGGSSGSPVFTADWEVLALHHAGSKNLSTLDGKAEYPANEGIWIDAIRRGVRKKGAGAARAKGTRKHS